jgi:hypothetical protein
MKKTKIVCFIISFLWIGLGTFVQISSYPDYNYLGFDYNSPIYDFLWDITFPSNILLFALLYAGTLDKIILLVILLQSFKVLIYWWLMYKICLFVQKVGKKYLRDLENEENETNGLSNE